jgi:hypothetical protein
VEQKMAGSLPAGIASRSVAEALAVAQGTAGRHATIIRSTFPYFINVSSYSLLPALNINSSFYSALHPSTPLRMPRMRDCSAPFPHKRDSGPLISL